MTTLTQSEAAILEQLREKPMQWLHMEHLKHDFFESLNSLYCRHLVNLAMYQQMWRTIKSMTICHLTHEGRLALIAWEKEHRAK